MKKYVLFTLLCASLYSYAGISPTFPNYLSKTIDVTKSIGTVSGSHGVGSDGSFGYTIPLYIPDGINGVQPSISINYNSRGGNGMLGWGWDVSAFSAISLDNKGLYYDNSVAPMTLKGINNTFSLSGNKLSLTNGSFGYNGSEYRTFEEGDSKISVSGTVAGCSSCPDKFIVQTKSGLTIEYGGSASTRIANADGIPLSWRISKIKDLYGNYAEYQYIQQNSEWVLDKIIYTKNDATGITAANTIQFTYIARNAGTDNNKFYIAGTNTSHLEIFQNNVLDKIDITSEGDMVR
ncbi:MAG: hypothetical protein K1X55_17115, partial [Chitinophagales bacterium]|nr:hypothetical protein [Chitinophagales bacterium]